MKTTERRQELLDWTDCVGLIVGIMLGTGIFTVFPKLAAAHAPSTGMILLAWLVGTAVALCGAFCFAELSSLFPKDGGEYIFLKEAFGRRGRSPLSFLFAWAQIFVIRPASLVSLAIILALNVDVLLQGNGSGNLPPEARRAVLHTLTYGTLAFFSFAVMSGLKTSKQVQNAFTAVKVLSLAVLVGGGLYLGKDKAANLAPLLPPEGASLGGTLKSMGMALIPVMWVFGGWNEAPYIAGDMKDPARNIPKALVIGLVGLGLLYTLINFIYVLHLTPEGLASSWTFSSDLMRMWFGPAGEIVMAVILVVSTAGALNGLTVTGARMTDAFAQDMGLLNGEEEHPTYISSLMLNLGLSLGLAFLVNCEPDSIDQLLVFTSGVVWVFFALVAGTVFVFRRRYPPEKLPYRSPLYPLTPLVFIVMCFFMLYGAWEYKPRETVYGILALLAGVPVYLLGTMTIGHMRKERKA